MKKLKLWIINPRIQGEELGEFCYKTLGTCGKLNMTEVVLIGSKEFAVCEEADCPNEEGAVELGMGEVQELGKRVIMCRYLVPTDEEIQIISEPQAPEFTPCEGRGGRCG